MNKLWYKTPASAWKHGLLIGNGRLAGNVFGDGHGERLGLNHELLYSAKYKDRECNPDSLQYLPEIRRLLSNGNYLEGTKLANQVYGGPGGVAIATKGSARIDSYKPAGELVILPDVVENRDYRRELDLDTSVVTVSYDGITYEYVADSVADKIYVHITGSLSARVGMEFLPDEDLRYKCTGNAYRFGAVGEYAGGMYFEVRVQVMTDGGFDGSQLTVNREALLVVDIETGMDGAAAVAERLSAREKRVTCAFRELIAPHLEKYRGVMNCLTLELDGEEPEDLPTDERIRIYRGGGTDLTLLKLYFDFGRYLLFAGSICGSMPLHLQGKWNNLPNPPWNSDYHNDINLEMNYWPAEAIGMGEAHLAMMNYIERILPQAKKAAKTLYGCRGVCLSLTDDIWGRATPEATGWDVWIGAAAWYGAHFYRHYEYTWDETFLRERAYPYMKEVCGFYEDYLIPDAQGILQVVPSQSPENYFVKCMEEGTNIPVSLCVSSAMDLCFVREIMTNTIQAAGILGVDEETIPVWQSILDRLQPLKIGSDGRLLEWGEELAEGEPGHRHLSHLYGVFPGGFITEKETPELFEAAKKSYDYRLSHGGGHTGWSRSWCANLDARFGRGDAALTQVKELIREFSSDSLLDLHPPKIFQIDGNFGGISGILEMLVQVSGERVKLLPALPSELPGGSIKGVHLPGGAVCDLHWRNGTLQKAQITMGVSGSVLLDGQYRVRGGAVSERDGETLVTAPAGTRITVTE